jgi:hypothetical protein
MIVASKEAKKQAARMVKDLEGEDLLAAIAWLIDRHESMHAAAVVDHVLDSLEQAGGAVGDGN